MGERNIKGIIEMKNNIDFLKIKKILGKNVFINEPMASHTTLGIGGPASLYAIAKSEEELKKYINISLKFKVPYMVIGGGSDILVSDEGYRGFIIVNKIEGLIISGDRVITKSGTNLYTFINYVIDHGFAGVEKLSGMPGTVGGAIYGNAGAYGQTISDSIIKVKSIKGTKINSRSKEKCKFGYRDSIFKKNKEVILEVEFKFEKGEREFLKKVSLDTISLRAQKYPPSMKCPGSFFKNIVASDLPRKVLDKIPKDKIIYGKIPAGFLMESVGANGQQKGNIKIADYHGNLIVNLGNGKATDLYDLAFDYAKKVEKKFGIKLEPEVQLVGFDYVNK